MNTGLQDAANLGWKLAAERAGLGAGRRCSTRYHDERHPVGRQVLRISGGMLRVAFSPPRRLAVLKQLAAGRPRRPPRRAPRRPHGLGHRSGVPAALAVLTRSSGRRAPDLQLAGGARLAEVLREGSFVLVTSRAADAADAADSAHLRIVEPVRGLRSTVLVRPDGYVAWAADDPTPAHVRNALTDWAVSA